MVREDKRAPGGFELTVKQLQSRRAPRPTIRSRPRSTASPSCWTSATSGSARRASTRSCACAARSRRPAATSFDERGFMLFDAPILTPTACEGTTTLFEIDYFGERKAYLTQSGQLYGEAGALAFGKVYCFGPTFRAEKSKTRRHLTEFWMVEPEVAYFDLDDDMQLAEDFVAYIVAPRARAPRARSCKALERDVEPLEARRSNALPAHHVRRGDRAPQGQGPPRQLGRRLRRRRGDGALAAVRPPGDRPPLSRGVQGLLHEARPRRAPRWRSASTCSRPRATARSSAAASARTTTKRSRRASRARAAARAVQLVPRSAPLRLGPPRRLRPGDRADGGVALRPAPCARDDSVPADDGAAGAMTPSASRTPFRLDRHEKNSGA